MSYYGIDKAVQKLFKYCSKIAKILPKFCANTVQVLCKYCQNFELISYYLMYVILDTDTLIQKCLCSHWAT